VTKNKVAVLAVNILLVIGSAATSLGVSEVLLRLLAQPMRYVVSDPVLGTKATARSDYDSRGFRNNIEMETASIVAIGDSQTYGLNVAAGKAWPQQLGEMTGKSVNQMAIPGYGPVQYAALLDRALSLHPETILVGLYLGNDLTDAFDLVYDNEYWGGLRSGVFFRSQKEQPTDYEYIATTGNKPDSLMYRMRQFEIRMRKHSEVYMLVQNFFYNKWASLSVKTRTKKAALALSDFARHNPHAVFYFSDSELNTALSPSYRLRSLSLDSPITAEGWRITKDRLKRMKEIAAGAGIRFVVVVIPTKESVYLGYFKKKDGKIPEVFVALDAKELEVEKKVRSFCVATPMECLFVAGALSEDLVNGSRIYSSTFDGHPNASGQRRIAEEVRRYLSNY
jgi:hypothetical protein